jgi:hypothetical protein
MAALAIMPPWARAVITILIAVIIAFALLLFFPDATGEQKTTEESAPSKWDDHIDALEKQALDDAFKKHIGQLYSVWVTDNYQPRIPPKALLGARNARDAYIRSMESIEKREKLPRWPK